MGVTHLALLMIDHNVMRFHVAVHYALAVAEVEGLEQLKDVEAHVEVGELGVQAPKVGVVHVFEDQTGCLALVQLEFMHDIHAKGDIGEGGQGWKGRGDIPGCP